MANKGKKAGADKSKGRVKVGKLNAKKELSASEAKKVKGGQQAETLDAQARQLKLKGGDKGLGAIPPDKKNSAQAASSETQ
ncbi:MAG: hypothetical protein DMF64_06875 [Acidobacteria bacterium]|nr:MAG: hypothetical protein DMF64_06875 [Acidobacteriota bacterium]